MNNFDLIEQTVLYGSVYEAIENKLFTCNELIKYLSEKVNLIPRNKLIISFTILMNLFPSSYLYYNGKHLLYYLPNDKLIYYIYLLKGGNIDLHVNQDKSTDDMLWLYLFDSFAALNSTKYDVDLESAFLFCDKEYKNSKNNYEYWAIEPLFFTRCNNISYKLNLNDKLMNEYYIRTDWFEKYVAIKNFSYIQFFNRCQYLQKNAPLYFEKFKFKFQSIMNHIKLYELEKFDKKFLLLINDIFPDCFSKHLSTCEEKYIKLCIYPIHIRAYILGFPIERYIPSKEEVDEKIELLMKLGIDEYVKGCNRKSLNNLYVSDENIANPEDTLCEDPMNYYAIDRYDLLQNNKIYRFTRKEFEKLLEDKKNFWNHCTLPEHAIATITVRLNMTDTMELPECDTAVNLLNKAIEGNLYQNLTKGDTEMENEVHFDSNYLLNLLSNALFTHHTL
jgi:hypothetical protein